MKFLRALFVVCVFLSKSYRCFSQDLPIKPVRTVSFSTDEGSYMDVNVSPDGKMLVFTLLGDLYMVSTSGGDATQITRGLALNSKPAWSADGKKIAYISDYSGVFHLNIKDFSGKFHVVLGKSDPPLNPNWCNLVWSSEGNYVYVGYVDAKNKNIAYGLTGGVAKFATAESYLSINGRSGFYIKQNWLYRYDLKTKESEKIDSVLGKPYEQAMVSGDGNWLAYYEDLSNGTKRCFIIQDLTRHSKRVLIDSLIVNSPHIPENQRPPAFSFSPDSRSIYIAYGGKIHQLDIPTGEGHIIPFVAKVKADLGPLVYNTYRVTHDSLQVRYTRFASTSPDGKHLVFMALNKLYIMDLPKGKPRQLVKQPGISQFQPVYSPDGKWIAYVSWCDTSGGQLWRVPALGGPPEQLTRLAAQYQRPSWSPNGNMIAIVHGDVKFSDKKFSEAEFGKLEVVDVNSHQEHVIDDNMIPMVNQICFSSNGRRLIYQPMDFNYQFYGNPFKGENDSLKPRLVSRDLSGKNQSIVALGSSSTKEPHYFQQRSISPDGRFIVYTMREDLYLVPFYPGIDAPVIFDSKQRGSMIRFASGVDPHWEQNGKLLAWTYGNQFCRINPDKIIKTAQEKIASGCFDTGLIKLNIKPDVTIPINLKVPTLYGKGTIALTNVRVITMQSNNVIEHATIVIKDGRFSQIGNIRSVKIPKEAKIFNLSGTTIMPGMIDMHMHVNCRENVYPLQKGDYMANLAYGVTTGRDPASSFDSFGASELIASGQTVGPRLFTVGRAIFQYSKFQLDDFTDALAIARKRKLLGGTYIKQYNLDSRLQKQWLLMACKHYGLNMTNEGNDDVASNMVLSEIAMIKDGSTGVEHNPDWGDAYKDVISFFAKSGSYLGETLGVGYGPDGDYYFNYTYWRKPDAKLKRFATSRYIDNDNTDKAFKWVTTLTAPTDKETIDSLVRYPAIIDAKITKLGGKITLGAHGSAPIGATAHNVLWAMKMGGLTNMQALQQATIRGAEALGIQKDLGSIEVGKIADLIILNANPLDDIHNSREIKYVMKDGVLYHGDTLDEIWPEKKKCPEWKLKIGLK